MYVAIEVGLLKLGLRVELAEKWPNVPDPNAAIHFIVDTVTDDEEENEDDEGCSEEGGDEEYEKEELP